MDAPESPTPVPALWPYALVCALAAVVVAFGPIHHCHHSDSLSPALVSLQRWTFFLWDQDRIGMLVPLIAMPVRHPVANLLVQDTIYLFAMLLAFYLLPRYLLRHALYPIVGTLGASALLLLAPAQWVHDFACNTFYGVWLSLGLGGLILAERPETGWRWPRLLVAFGLLVLTHWVYSAAALLLGPLILGRGFLTFRDEAWTWRRWLVREASVPLLLLGVAFAIGYGLMCLPWEATPTHVGTAPLPEWPVAWVRLLQSAWDYLYPQRWPACLLGAAGIGLVHVLLQSGDARPRLALRGALVLFLSAALLVLFMGTRRWMKENDYNWRYTHPAAFLAQMGMIFVAAAPLQAVSGRLLARGLAPLVVGVALAHYGLPSMATVRYGIDRALSRCTSDILDAQCTLVAGGYWEAWPSVFHANLMLRERGEARQLYGIAPRGGATRAFWKDWPPEQLRVAVPLKRFWLAEDPRPASEVLNEVNFYMESLGLPPMVVVERRPTILVLVPRSLLESAPVPPAPTLFSSR